MCSKSMFFMSVKRTHLDVRSYVKNHIVGSLVSRLKAQIGEVPTDRRLPPPWEGKSADFVH